VFEPISFTFYVIFCLQKVISQLVLFLGIATPLCL
jgi:hypothetical protein